jgi:L-lactate dehydrogenase (cytochrome)
LTTKSTTSQNSYLCGGNISVFPWEELLTGALQLHPGGRQIILKYAGKDATAVYKPIHPDDALEKNLAKEKHLGFVDADAARELQRVNTSRKRTKEELRVERARQKKPPLGRILTLQDMEVRIENHRPTPGSMT